MRKLEKDLRKLRPSLFDVSKLEAHIILAYGVFNVLIGPVLITLPKANVPVVFPLWVWGIAFTALGLWMLTALWANSWRWAKASLLAGVGIKTVWLIVLLLIAIHSNASVALLWVTFTWIQILCYVFFPTVGVINDKR